MGKIPPTATLWGCHPQVPASGRDWVLHGTPGCCTEQQDPTC